MWDAIEDGFDRLRDFLGTVPFVLRIAAIASLVLGVVLVLSPLLPGMSFNVDGTLLDRVQMWETRVAYAMLAVGPLMIACGVGIFLRRRWSRFILLIMPVLQLLPFQIVHWLFGAPNPTVFSVLGLLVCVVVWFVGVALLLTSQSVRSYYANAP